MAVTNEDILAALERMQGKDGNGDAVTLAVLQSQQEAMKQTLDKRTEMQDDDHDRIAQVEGDMKVLKTRVGLFAGVQVLLVTLGSAIAAKLGMSR